MHLCSLLVLTTVATGATGAPAAPLAASARPTPLAESLALVEPVAAPLSAAPLAQRGGIVTPRRPSFFVSGGYHLVEAEHNWDEDDDDALSLDVGYMTWSGDMGFALEAGVMQSSFETDVTVFLRDDVDTTRYLVGLRFLDASPTSRFQTYLRGGFVYREDEGDLIDDDGTGWYLGGGVDLILGYGFSIAPQVLYSETSSLDSTEWLLGATATFAF